MQLCMNESTLKPGPRIFAAAPTEGSLTLQGVNLDCLQPGLLRISAKSLGTLQTESNWKALAACSRRSSRATDFIFRRSTWELRASLQLQGSCQADHVASRPLFRLKSPRFAGLIDAFTMSAAHRRCAACALRFASTREGARSSSRMFGCMLLIHLFAPHRVSVLHSNLLQEDSFLLDCYLARFSVISKGCRKGR